MSTPILPFAVWASGTNQNSVPANDNSRRNQILNGLVIDDATTSQPVSPSDGDIYILPATHTGAQWSTFDEDDLVIYSGGTWYAFAPVDGVVVNFDGAQQQWTTGGGWTTFSGGGGGVPDGDKGDITVSGSGATWTIDNQAVTYAKMQNISAQYRLLGRNSASAGSAEEVTLSQLLDWVGSAANGDILYRTGGAWARLAVGTNGQVLTVSSNLPSWQTGGGGGLTNITEAISTASPNNTVNAVSLSVTGGTTNTDFVLAPKAGGALTTRVADGTSTGGNKRGSQAVDLQSARASASQVASGATSFIAGTQNTASGTSAVALGENNTSSGTSAVALGVGNAASANYATSLGRNNNVSAANASALGGQQHTVNAIAATAVGGVFHNSRSIVGLTTFGAASITLNAQRMQGELPHLGITTTSAAPAILTTNGSGTAAATNQLTLGNNSIEAFLGVVTAKSSGGDAAAWKIEGAIKRNANAASTSLVGTPSVTSLGADAGASTWTVGITADTTNGCLTITVTGAASTNITWGASLLGNYAATS